MGISEKILAYLSIYGRENKYRLASALKIGADEVTRALSALEKEGRIEIKGGRAILVKGKKPITTKTKKQKKQKVKRERLEEEQKAEPEEEPAEETTEKQEEVEQPEETKEQPEEIEKVEETPAEEEPEKVSEETTEGEVQETFGVKDEKEEERIEGTVKFFNQNKGFGFITGDDGKEYYVHKSALKEGVTIEEKNRVSFRVVEGDKGPKAEDVEWISQA